MLEPAAQSQRQKHTNPKEELLWSLQVRIYHILSFKLRLSRQSEDSKQKEPASHGATGCEGPQICGTTGHAQRNLLHSPGYVCMVSLSVCNWLGFGKVEFASHVRLQQKEHARSAGSRTRQARWKPTALTWTPKVR